MGFFSPENMYETLHQSMYVSVWTHDSIIFHTESSPSPGKNTYHEIIRWAEGYECDVWKLGVWSVTLLPWLSPAGFKLFAL